MGDFRRVGRGAVAAIAAVAAMWAAASAQSAQPNGTVAVPAVTEAPKIDGDLTAPAWAKAAKVSLIVDLKNRTPADQATTAYLMADARYLYVGFDAKQSTSISAAQHTDDVGAGTDDTVTVYLWPSGQSGFAYTFTSNPIGTHYQSSSENQSYAPTWSSAGKLIPGGYSVTMRIPLAALRGGHDWHVALERFAVATLDDYVWPYVPGETGPGSVIYAAALTGLGGNAAKTRPQARFGVYGLGALAAPSIGGATSRVGVDASIPITATSSFVATVHPDYSNVELDQQTIAPTAFARSYSEVRPFFAQLDNYFGSFNCIGCPGVTELYTPAIPTPRYGYAVEGKQGGFGFAGFDSVGDRRTDTAQIVGYHTPDLKWHAAVQRTGVDGTGVCPYVSGVSSLSCLGVPAVHEDTSLYGISHDSLKGLYEFANFGSETGTFVTDPGAAHRRDVGIGAYDKDSFLGFSLQQFGAQYLAVPLSSYTSQTDLSGFSTNGDTTIYRKPTDFVSRIILYGTVDAYHDATGRMDRYDTQAAIGLDLPHRIHIRAQTGSDYVRLADGNFVPTNQNGINLNYNYNTDVPVNLSYFTGRFGPGKLDSWADNATVRLGPALLTVEADENTQWLDGGYPRLTSWLERGSLALQQGKNASLALGVRRIVGRYPILEDTFQSGAFVPPPYYDAWNVSGAYYRRFPQDELYLVYGDAGAFSTSPQFIVKWIHYFGAGKGT